MAAHYVQFQCVERVRGLLKSMCIPPLNHPSEGGWRDDRRLACDVARWVSVRLSWVARAMSSRAGTAHRPGRRRSAPWSRCRQPPPRCPGRRAQRVGAPELIVFRWRGPAHTSGYVTRKIRTSRSSNSQARHGPCFWPACGATSSLFSPLGWCGVLVASWVGNCARRTGCPMPAQSSSGGPSRQVGAK